ncbi:ABC transporter permease [Puniceicoccales bacterium CK1056]|uniref:ABC transporter permease n=1 Tax=Oceanipulchritudo coccoides TaxID=2706888 RepID=A0A6B2M2D2_9BACT|nr:FtsX-like permease family protein [Oceanipulchritudo coccoides]NDV62359.1 ABC transporter permease [Oceanipulchritudo coccoides]
MRQNILIAWRFLIAKKRAMLMSLTGIVFGVAFFIFTQAQTTGFESFFIRTILGTNGTIRVQDEFQNSITSMVVASDGAGGSFEVPLREGRKYLPGIRNPEALIDAIKQFESVEAATPVLRGDIQISSGFRTESGRVIGMEPKEYIEVSDLEYQIVYGDLRTFAETPDGLIMGRRLAERLEASPGSFILLSHLGETRRYRVSGIFETGIDFFDKTHVFTHLQEARRLLNKMDRVSYIQIMTKDPDMAPATASQMEHALGHYVASWQEREKSWLEVFRVLRISSALSMSTIILIAGLGMFNTLAIIVMERSREIAILRSFGFSRNDILNIFLYQGLIVYVLGTLIGFVLAAILTRTAESLPIRIRGIFSTDHFLVSWSIWHYASAAIVAGIVVVIAALIPARRAARTEPGEVIRGTGG